MMSWIGSTAASFCNHPYPGKSNLPFELLGRAGDCSRVTEGQKRPHLGLFPGPNVPLQGPQGSQVCIPDSPRESGLVLKGSKGLRSPFKSRRALLGTHFGLGPEAGGCAPDHACDLAPHCSARTHEPAWRSGPGHLFPATTTCSRLLRPSRGPFPTASRPSRARGGSSALAFPAGVTRGLGRLQHLCQHPSEAQTSQAARSLPLQGPLLSLRPCLTSTAV